MLLTGFNRVGFCGISARGLGFISSFLRNKRPQLVLDGKYLQDIPINHGVPQRPILGHTIFLLNINDLSGYVICNIAIYADDTTP